MNDLRQGPAHGDERDRGSALIAKFNGALRGARMYGAQSPTLQQLVGELLELVQSLMEDDLSMVVMGDYFYVNDMRLKPQPSQITLFRALMTEFEGRGLGGVRIQNGVSLQELSTFLHLMAAIRDEEQGEKLIAEMNQAGIANILPIRAKDLQAEAQDENEPMERTPNGERRRAQRTFWRAVNGTRDLVLGAAKSGRPALRQARRLVQPMVDSLMKNEYSIIGLTAIKDHDEYTYAHCVNVSVLSIGMGQALGLPRAALANLGVAGLLHDIGKIEVPVAVLQKPGKLSPEEWQVVRRHPLEGLKMVSRMPGVTTLTVEAMRVCFEHHMTMDRGGYPQFPKPHEPATSSRIVAVADFFDAITAHRSYRRRPLTSFEALSMLLGPEREHFDPAVLWALVKSVGLYPAGTVMLTTSNHVVLSVSPNLEDRRRPHCRVLVHPDGTTPPEDHPEMWDPMPATESVARVLQPEEHAVPAGSLAA